MTLPDFLRPWREDDVPVLLAVAQEPLMSRQFTTPLDSRETALDWISVSCTDRGYAFAVLSSSGDPVGNVAVASVDRRHLTGWVSYWVASSARGQGLATRACHAVSEWAFAELGLFRLELGHRLDNPASCKVALAAGFSSEGVERSRLLYDGVRYDVERHARLATD